MEMVSMKIEHKEKPEHEMMEMPEQKYPYGLKVCLCEEEIKKLGIELPEVGSEMKLMAKVMVTSVSKDESIYGMNRRLELQIVEMGLSGAKAKE